MTLERSPTMTGQVGRSPNLHLNAGDNQVPSLFSPSLILSPLPSPPPFTPHPNTDIFPEHQLYIVYAAENSGMQLGSYVVSTPHV